MLTVISWNICRSPAAWRQLLGSGADIALLQEASEPPPDVADSIEVDSAPWETAGTGSTRNWRTAVVRLSNHVQVEWLGARTIAEAERGGLAVSRPGTLSAARVTPGGGEAVIVASLYGAWEKPHADTNSSWIYADASVHRLISDLSALVGRQVGHRVIAAGDLNVLNGYGENGSPYWAARYATVFQRMIAIGLPFVGPQAPHGGRQADTWPNELPSRSLDVPTFHHSRQNPATASRQLDFVFASASLVDEIEVIALNEPDEWGPSDHCRLKITLP
jgi:hypothetical protein